MSYLKTVDFFRHFFDSEVQIGASALLQAVELLPQERPELIQAEVHEQSSYDTYLVLDPPNIYSGCNCAFVRSRGEMCRHIWALLLVAARKKLLNMYASQQNPSIELDVFGVRFNEIMQCEAPVAEQQGIVTEQRKAKSSAMPDGAGRLAVDKIKSSENAASTNVEKSVEPAMEFKFELDVNSTIRTGFLTLNICHRKKKKNNVWRNWKSCDVAIDFKWISDPLDLQILKKLMGEDPPRHSNGKNTYVLYDRYAVNDIDTEALLRELCATGRFYLEKSGLVEDQPYIWDDGAPWNLSLTVRRNRTSDDNRYIVEGYLQRQNEECKLTDAPIVLLTGQFAWNGRFYRYSSNGGQDWIARLRSAHFEIASKDIFEFRHSEQKRNAQYQIDWPDELTYETRVLAPRFCLRLLKQDARHNGKSDYTYGSLLLDYGQFSIEYSNMDKYILDEREKIKIERDMKCEERGFNRLFDLGFDMEERSNRHNKILKIKTEKLSKIVNALLAEGWRVVTEKGQQYISDFKLQFEIAEDADWFELKGSVRFSDREVKLPDLIAALKRKSSIIELGDGRMGVLSEYWYNKLDFLFNLGKVGKNTVRFKAQQIVFFDGLLDVQPQTKYCASYLGLREKLKRFDGVRPLPAPATFAGVLRPYQSEGLGWFRFLDEFGFGGCLADDMGLGKTIQILALLEDRRIELSRSVRGQLSERRPSLVVVPKSLVFNWIQEARRFTPLMRLLEYTGSDRAKNTAAFDDYDLIVTTYGTIRNDAQWLKDFSFDYIILDEAQAIKNADTASAKKVNLLHARRKLAMTGTPVENRIEELWSIFEFLNPGMLGASAVFKRAMNNSDGERQNIALLSKALRPFILRRTKSQVVKELPPKLEQTIFCTLDPEERRNYNELRDYYRNSLKAGIARNGIGKSKILILEALLRLRQAACHPGLIDRDKVDTSSTKLDLLLEHLEEAMAEQSKALVFSQFTSLLQILIAKLDQRKVTYAYMDGKTRDRAAVVANFKNNPDLRLFLVSLKTGGVGLNLTEAEYVFMLDPWWNPAVEAQAIDRTHRIGQTKRVFAYRLIAKDTVEEKVLALQEKKRTLAESIITADNRLLSSLTQEDLELLLS